MIKQDFKAGDIVRYIPTGDKEYILEESGDIKYPLSIKHVNCFTLDGRISVNHTNPLLILIRRPEEKKKWYQVFYKFKTNGRPDVSTSLYENEEDFYTHGISKECIEWIELKFVCER